MNKVPIYDDRPKWMQKEETGSTLVRPSAGCIGIAVVEWGMSVESLAAISYRGCKERIDTS